MSKKGLDIRTTAGTGILRADGVVTSGQNYIVDSADALVSVDPVYSKIVSVTLAELNAGKPLIPAIPGRTIRVIGYYFAFNGTFTTATAIVLQDTAASPVNVVSIAIAGAVTATKISSEAVQANTTDGAAYLANATASKGISIAKTGSSAAGGTSLVVMLKYNVI